MIVRPGPGLRLAELHPAEMHAYPLDDRLIAQVVPVYQPAGAAAITYDDTLSPLRVDEAGAAVAERISGYVPAISGGELAALRPAGPGPALAYLQSRRLIRYDLAQRAHRLLRLVQGDQVAIAGMWLSGQESRVAVQIEDTSRYDEGVVLARVDVFELAGARVGAVDLERPRAAGQGWAAGAGLVAVARAGGLEVRDASLAVVPDHPLALAVRGALAEVSASEVHALRIHPDRPLAAVVACTRDVMGLRDYAVWRVTWEGPAEVRLLAQVLAVGDVDPGGFSPAGELLDLRVTSSGATRLVVIAGVDRVLDLGLVRALQAACWSGPPLRYLAFERAGPQVLVWSWPEVPA